MNELVLELRAVAAAAPGTMATAEFRGLAELLTDAANEIERLERELSTLRARI